MKVGENFTASESITLAIRQSNSSRSSSNSRVMTELQRDAPLFDKMLVIRLQSGLQEARQIPLTVRIIPGIRPTSIHGQNEKLFHFEVSR